ncbi:MAG TPA: agmatine deiminase family protein [Bacteroidaceae bacterium]|nr:agmatine deiminase family protein [Bacteroidaceae bacterium]
MRRVPSEWEPQECVQLTWPHADTDWRDMLERVTACFVEIAKVVAERERVLIVTPVEGKESVLQALIKGGVDVDNVTLFECPTNDTWARDHAFITSIENDSSFVLNDFGFNGWGLKYDFYLDNLINSALFGANMFKNAQYCNMNNLILEGGSIESDGKGTLLTTLSCLLAKNRNGFESLAQARNTLSPLLGVDNFLCLEHGAIVGDDTDGHIDTLARLCPDNSILYVKCYNGKDEHFVELSAMEKELLELKTANGDGFNLVPLPLPEPIYDGEFRLPATYANYLVINGAVLMPMYGQRDNDNRAKEIIGAVFKGRDIIGIDCLPLIMQRGSLHCVTMNYPKGVGLF